MDVYGIDYGNKLAGTTVICSVSSQNAFHFTVAEKGKDADAFLLEYFQHRAPALLFLDAPLSLPSSLLHPHPEGDFFFRKADRETKAMSPMFLGGLTARAIKIKYKLQEYGHQVRETYPGLFARNLGLKELGYKKKGLADCLVKIDQPIPGILEHEEVKTWHHLDSLLACWSGIRYKEGNSVSYGEEDEGLIFV